MLSTETELETKTIKMTCPVCGKALEFSISEEELRKTGLSLNIVKKAVNHGDDHIVVVHINEQGIVKRSYGYECVVRDNKPETPSKVSKPEKTPPIPEKRAIIDHGPSEPDHGSSEPDKEFQSYLGDLLANMTKSAKHGK
ncbi:MAG: hypothetical protein ACFFD4_36790 [Candidatus Odinarchaeota archaeon]